MTIETTSLSKALSKKSTQKKLQLGLLGLAM